MRSADTPKEASALKSQRALITHHYDYDKYADHRCKNGVSPRGYRLTRAWTAAPAMARVSGPEPCFFHTPCYVILLCIALYFIDLVV